MKNPALVWLGAWVARWRLAVAVATAALVQTASAQTAPAQATSNQATSNQAVSAQKFPVAPAASPPAASPAASPTAVLARPVRFARAATVPLAQGLAELARQSGVPISYSSSRIGAGRRCQLRAGAARPLGQALAEMLGPNALAAGLLGGQLVLWPAAESPPPGVVRLRAWAAAVAPEAPTALVARAAFAAPVAPAMRAAAAPSAAPATSASAKSESSRKAISNARKPAGVRPPSPFPASPAGRVGAANSRAKPAASSKSALGFGASLPPLFAANAAGPAAANPANRRLTGTARTNLARSVASTKPSSEAPFSRKPPATAARRRPPPAPLQNTVFDGRGEGPQNPVLPDPQAVVSGTIDPLPGRIVRALIPAGAAPETRPLAPVAVPPALVRQPLRRRLGQVSLVPPLGTGGLANARTVNGLSLNVLAGYAAGVRGVEIGGLLNVVRDTVRGGQVAGLLNVVGTDVRGVQLAGLGNIGGGGVRGLQAAGTFNVARDDVRGLQLAGLLNVVGGAALAGPGANASAARPTRLRRWLGLPRLLATDGLAQLPAAPSASQPGGLVQLAGLANLTGTDVRGLQAAPLLNVARRVRGLQLGLLNVARTVRGSQVGLVNICDSLTGASIGFVNIVRRGGYRRGEVWASESLPLNAVFKLGVPRFYTIFGAAAEPFGSRVAWAAGFGIGTTGRPHGRFTFSLDLMQWTLAGTTSDLDAAQIDQRLLTQLRPALAWQIERAGHLQLVVAPTLNLANAWQNDGQPNWDFGSNQWLWIETAGSQSQARLWPGLHVGLRF